ncbi:MAG: hypothetical protein ISS70_00055 [Phycisphaerae bacterium]|nr:hypothetical protein [Phycisphaerae bacterium]
MGYRNNRIDSCPDGCRANRRGRGKAGLVWIVALAVVLLASAGPALGQFTVTPLKFDLQLRPGKRVVSVLDIQSLDPNETHTIDLSVVELTQDEKTAAWQIIEPNSGFDSSTLSSLKDAMTLSTSTVTIEPHQKVPVEVRLRVPPGSRGFSCAGIVAAIRPRADATDISFVLRFMVPVLLEIQGRPMRNQVQATDLTMEVRKADSYRPATTLLTMGVENKGGTFPRCRPVARIWSWSGGHWRVITTTAFQDKSSDVGIIPGAKIDIETDLNKALPPGKYKVAGVLYVDGTRTARVEKMIDFAGDPSVTRVAADTPLDLKPSGLTVQSMPGATRSTMLKVYNASDETVNIQAVLVFPRDLGSKAMGTIRGADMDCTPWVTIVPERFTLSGEGDVQNVRISTAMPDSATTLPCYYSNLDLWAFYPDGQRAGVTTANICVQNTKTKGEPSALALKMTPHAVSGSIYQIVAQFSNNGIIHFDPKKCKAAVIESASTTGIPRASTTLEGVVKGVMLPFEERSFSGMLDFGSLDAGSYRLSAALEYAPGQWAEKQTAIEVTTEGDRRVIRTTGTQEDLPEILEMKWSKAPSRAISGNKRG